MGGRSRFLGNADILGSKSIPKFSSEVASIMQSSKDFPLSIKSIPNIEEYGMQEKMLRSLCKIAYSYDLGTTALGFSNGDILLVCENYGKNNGKMDLTLTSMVWCYPITKSIIRNRENRHPYAFRETGLLSLNQMIFVKFQTHSSRLVSVHERTLIILWNFHTVKEGVVPTWSGCEQYSVTLIECFMDISYEIRNNSNLYQKVTDSELDNLLVTCVEFNEKHDLVYVGLNNGMVVFLKITNEAGKCILYLSDKYFVTPDEFSYVSGKKSILNLQRHKSYPGLLLVSMESGGIFLIDLRSKLPIAILKLSHLEIDLEKDDKLKRSETALGLSSVESNGFVSLTGDDSKGFAYTPNDVKIANSYEPLLLHIHWRQNMDGRYIIGTFDNDEFLFWDLDNASVPNLGKMLKEYSHDEDNRLKCLEILPFYKYRFGRRLLEFVSSAMQYTSMRGSKCERFTPPIYRQEILWTESIDKPRCVLFNAGGFSYKGLSMLSFDMETITNPRKTRTYVPEYRLFLEERDVPIVDFVLVKDNNVFSIVAVDENIRIFLVSNNELRTLLRSIEGGSASRGGRPSKCEGFGFPVLETFSGDGSQIDYIDFIKFKSWNKLRDTLTQNDNNLKVFKSSIKEMVDDLYVCYRSSREGASGFSEIEFPGSLDAKAQENEQTLGEGVDAKKDGEREINPVELEILDNMGTDTVATSYMKENEREVIHPDPQMNTIYLIGLGNLSIVIGVGCPGMFRVVYKLSISAIVKSFIIEGNSQYFSDGIIKSKLWFMKIFPVTRTLIAQLTDGTVFVFSFRWRFGNKENTNVTLVAAVGEIQMFLCSEHSAPGPQLDFVIKTSNGNANSDACVKKPIFLEQKNILIVSNGTNTAAFNLAKHEAEDLGVDTWSCAVPTSIKILRVGDKELRLVVFSSSILIQENSKGYEPIFAYKVKDSTNQKLKNIILVELFDKDGVLNEDLAERWKNDVISESNEKKQETLKHKNWSDIFVLVVTPCKIRLKLLKKYDSKYVVKSVKVIKARSFLKASSVVRIKQNLVLFSINKDSDLMIHSLLDLQLLSVVSLFPKIDHLSMSKNMKISIETFGYICVSDFDNRTWSAYGFPFGGDFPVFHRVNVLNNIITYSVNKRGMLSLMKPEEKKRKDKKICFIDPLSLTKVKTDAIPAKTDSKMKNVFKKIIDATSVYSGLKELDPLSDEKLDVLILTGSENPGEMNIKKEESFDLVKEIAERRSKKLEMVRDNLEKTKDQSREFYQNVLKMKDKHQPGKAV